MTPFDLVRKNLFRKKLRTLLTTFAIFVAFLIFGVLATFQNALNSGEESASADRLIVTNKINFTLSMPISYVQRVAIARAIVSDPKLLLCDEPTGDLDRETAGEILAMLQTLNRDLGKTVVIVTHDPEAARFAKRTIHLDKGHFTEKDLSA